MLRIKIPAVYPLRDLMRISGAAVLLMLFISYTPIPAHSAVQDGLPSQQALSAGDIERARNYFTDTELTTHDGKQVKFYSDMLDGRIVLINVMYTSCTGACPLTTQKLIRVSQKLGEMYGNDIQFISITNDPARDTPEALTKFASDQKVNLDGWTFLTGSKENVNSVIKKLGLYTEKFEQHKAQFLIGNTITGRWQKVRPDMPYQAITTKLAELAGEF